MLANVPYFVLYCISFIGLLIILFLHDNRYKNDKNILESQGIIAVAIALNLAFSFFCLVCLLGYALVKIPSHWWRDADFKNKLNRLLFDISNFDEKIID